MLIVGSTGYVVIEGWSVFDAAYMTVVTMTTVGYEEVRPLSQAGRAFNLFVMLGGVGLMLYILTVTVQAVVEDEVLKGLFRRRRMRAKLKALEQHYILCGYGRVGREVATVFRGEEAAFVVIDTNEAAEADGILAICGNATQNEMLRHVLMSNPGRPMTTILDRAIVLSPETPSSTPVMPTRLPVAWRVSPTAP